MTSSPDACRPWEPPRHEEEGAAQILPFPAGTETSRAETVWSPPALTAGGKPAGAGVDPRSVMEAAREEAYARGRADGLQEGAAVAGRDLHPTMQALQHAAEALASARDSVTRDLVDNLHALALGIARKLVLREVTTDPDIIRTLIGRALELVPPSGPMEIRVNPTDFAQLEAEFPSLLQGAGHDAAQIKPDGDLERGSFVLENPNRIVDGRVDTALRALYERLEDE